MRVLHLSSGSLFGGVETFLIELARWRWPRGGMDPFYTLTEEGRLSDELRALGAPVHLLGRVRIRNPVGVRRARRELLGLLSREPFDVAICHSQWAHALFGPVIRAAGIPLVFYLHGNVTGRHWLELLARRTPPDLVLTNSHFTASTSENLFSGVRCEMLRYPVPPPPENSTAESTRRIREELRTPGSDVVIVQTSRMEAWKGHRLHLETLRNLRDLPGWTSWLVGGAQRKSEATYQRDLQRKAEEYGIADRVRFAGQRSDVPAVLAAADVHFQPNLGPEPFGIAFVEALNARLPVVTTALGGPMEIVDDTCGILAPPGDALRLSEALRSLILDGDLRRSLGGAGPVRAAALCDPERQVARITEVLATVARQGDARSRRPA
jgi:glycosyltransferase involved in cell wall biosynthesis